MLGNKCKILSAAALGLTIFTSSMTGVGVVNADTSATQTISGEIQPGEVEISVLRDLEFTPVKIDVSKEKLTNKVVYSSAPFLEFIDNTGGKGVEISVQLNDLLVSYGKDNPDEGMKILNVSTLDGFEFKYQGLRSRGYEEESSGKVFDQTITEADGTPYKIAEYGYITGDARMGSISHHPVNNNIEFSVSSRDNLLFAGEVSGELEYTISQLP